MKPLVYIASAYTKGDPAINTHFQCMIFDHLMTDGIVLPYPPLWSHFQHTLFPRPYKDWVEYDLALITKMDACLRLTAEYYSRHIKYSQQESSGADNEVEAFLQAGKPVFYDIESLHDWAKGFTQA